MDAAHISEKPAWASVMTPERRKLAADLFDRLHEMSFDGVGISRETYGPKETEAMQMVETFGQEHGFDTRWDAARNLILSCHGRNANLPVVASGSHLDSVPQGGNFDGAAGVIAAMMALLAAKDRNPLRTLELYVLRAEESAWYGGPSLMGSRAMFGRLSETDLASTHQRNGETLAANMARAGADVSAIKADHPLIEASHFHCWMELHIEQAPVLIARDKPVGIVTGIRGSIRYRNVVCRGEAAHSGAVPRWLRHDAVLAMADLLMRIDEHWRVLLEWGEDLVVTSGIVQTNPDEHAITRVPGEVSFALDFRSQSQKTLNSFSDLIRSECNQIEAKRGVRFDLGPPMFNKPAKMSDALIALAGNAANTLDIDHEVMASGAGHDTGIFANAGVPATMVFVRNQNGSHNPNEAMALEDFYAGAEVLGQALLQAAEMKDELAK